MKAHLYSDIHLEACDSRTKEDFIQTLVKSEPEILIIAGDIERAKGVCAELTYLSRALPASKIYFVLGNHDYYDGSLEEVFQSVSETARASDNLVYLSDSEASEICPGTFIVGDDGFYDLQCGQVNFAAYTSSDFTYIQDFNVPSMDEQLDKAVT